MGRSLITICILHLLHLSSAAASKNGPLPREPSSPSVNGPTYDFIIVGGGLSGLVVARRLSEDPRKNVLVIENGPIDDGPATSIPYYANVLNTADFWPLVSAPEPFLNNQTFTVPAGNVVGGGTIVNGMIFDRGSDADYDAWEKLGNVGWGYEGLKPYFKKSQTFTPPSKSSTKAFNITYEASAYGDSGPVAVTIPSFEYPDIAPIFSAWAAENVSMPREGFAEPVGAYWCPADINNVTQTRAHSRASYYDPVRNRTNLKLLPNTKVTQILFDTKGQLSATGVKMLNNIDGSVSTAYARMEVVLAAGAIFTPHLLMVSGVGPKDVLAAAKVPVKLDAPGVGSNLQDHPSMNQVFNISNLNFPTPSTLPTNATFYAAAEAQYYAERQGPLTYPGVTALAFLPLKQWSPENFASIARQILAQKVTKYLPDRYSKDSALLAGYKKQRDILVKAFLGDDAAAGENVIVASGYNGNIIEKPLSRGTITLNNTDPTNLPIVQWNGFQNPAELDIIVEMIRFGRRHWARPELARYNPVENIPGLQYQTNAELINLMKTTNGLLTPTLAHLSCTCAMMPLELGGVVSDQLLVYGVKGLSIVDASIMPLIPATHLQATVYAISEKASDIIKARHSY